MRQPAQSLGEGSSGGSVGQAGVGEHHRRQVGGNETAGVHGARRRECDKADTECRDRIQTRGRQRDAPQRHRTQEATQQTYRGTGQQFVHDLHGGAFRLEHKRHDAEHQHQDHGGGIVESGLRLQQPRKPTRQRQHPQHRKDRRGVGRGHDGPEQQGQLPVHAQQHMRTERRDYGADHHADRGQRAGRSKHLADIGKPRGQTTFDEDHRECGGAHIPGQLHVVELEAKPVLSEDDSDEKEEQQAGKSDACRDPGTHDAGEQYQPTDEQVQVQLVQAHFVPVGRL
ncbi:Uncharacterised protein [Mycobacteroides abscessus subsp. massiliense]|nr:Uncharacterised protein [Mycobacteroides abscessus subsp. massiliense]